MWDCPRCVAALSDSSDPDIDLEDSQIIRLIEPILHQRAHSSNARGYNDLFLELNVFLRFARDIGLEIGDRRVAEQLPNQYEAHARAQTAPR